jgi:hypothetical protein
MKENPNVVQKTSEDNHKYKVLKTPCTVELECEAYQWSDLPDGFRVHHPYVKAAEIQRKFLPLEANLREPTMSSQVHDMLDTLAGDPQNFFKKNNGMTTVCSKVSDKKGQVPPDDTNAADGKTVTIVLHFQEGEGVCNGGHTYFSFVSQTEPVSDDALVHLEILELPPGMSVAQKKQETRLISLARNNNNRVAQRSEADFLDFYAPFKAALKHPEWISWHEGDAQVTKLTKPMRSDDFLRMLSALDPLVYRHHEFNQKGPKHKTPVTQVKSIHSGWFNATEDWIDQGRKGPAPMSHLAWFGDEIFRLRDLMAMTWSQKIKGSRFRNTRLYKDNIEGNTKKLLTARKGEPAEGEQAPPTVEALVLGYFRSDVWLHTDSKAQIKYIGWYVDPEQLWEARKVEALEHLAQSYTDAEQEIVAFIRKDAPYNFDLYNPGYGRETPLPEIVIDVSTGQRYRKSEAEKATHVMVKGDPDGMAHKGKSIPEGAQVAFYQTAG